MKKSFARKGNKTLFWWLQRRSNGVEQINYDAASSSSSSFAEDLSDSSSFITPSLEFPNRTSFVFRESEFEMDQTLDDLAISFERNDHNVPAQDLSEAGPSGAVVDDDIENFSTSVRRDGGMVGNKLGIKRTPTILVKSKGYLVPNDAVAVGGGIKGLRPPVLKPPPSMKRPPIDLQGSSWDFLTYFAPKSETNKRPSFSFSTDSRSDEEEVETKIKYDAASSCNSSAEDYFSDSTSSFITPSLEFPDRTSFVFRKNEFEMDPLPEDFTISFDDNSEHSEVFASGGSIITSWQKGQLLGRGSFCSVYAGFSGDGDFFAVKEISLLDKGFQAQECIKQVEGEIALLSQLQHQNIVRYRGTAKDGSNLYIFLELVTQGCLLKLYQRYQRLQDSVVSGYTRQILDGLTYLHYKGFIHRDIKCANILVAANGVVKLADFGLAKVSTLNDNKSCKGSPFWIAPEVINRKGNDGYGSPADKWSLGCTVLEMLTSKIPYGNLEPVKALFRIGRGKLPEVLRLYH